MLRRPSRRQAVEEAWDALRRVMSGMHVRMRASLAELNVTPPQIYLLRVLMEKEGATPKELAGICGVTPGNVTGLVNKLERAGLVVRSRGANDRRVVHLRPTAKARRGMATMHAASLHSMEEAFRDWPTEDIVRFGSLLERLAGDEAASR